MEAHEKREELNRQRKRIQEIRGNLRGSLGKMVAASIASGEIREMPDSELEVQIGNGWSQKHVYAESGFDLWIREAEKGQTLPPHSHPDHYLFILVLEGELDIEFGPEDGHKLTTRLGKDLNSFEIPQGELFSLKPVTDVRILCVFIPPISSTS